LKAGQADFEDKIATVYFQLVLKICQRINEPLNCMQRVQPQGFEEFWIRFQNHILKLSHKYWEMEQSRTGVMLLHYIADAGSWRKQMVIFCMLKTIRTLSSVIEDFNFIVV
jgi:hypothetical protein